MVTHITLYLFTYTHHYYHCHSIYKLTSYSIYCPICVRLLSTHFVHIILVFSNPFLLPIPLTPPPPSSLNLSKVIHAPLLYSRALLSSLYACSQLQPSYTLRPLTIPIVTPSNFKLCLSLAVSVHPSHNNLVTNVASCSCSRLLLLPVIYSVTKTLHFSYLLK